METKDDRNKRDSAYSVSGLNISKRSYNYKEMAKAEQRWKAKMDWEFAKERKQQEDEWETNEEKKFTPVDKKDWKYR